MLGGSVGEESVGGRRVESRNRETKRWLAIVIVAVWLERDLPIYWLYRRKMGLLMIVGVLDG